MYKTVKVVNKFRNLTNITNKFRATHHLQKFPFADNNKQTNSHWKLFCDQLEFSPTSRPQFFFPAKQRYSMAEIFQSNAWQWTKLRVPLYPGIDSVTEKGREIGLRCVVRCTRFLLIAWVSFVSWKMFCTIFFFFFSFCWDDVDCAHRRIEVIG